FLAINHLEGHLLSPFFGREKIEPNVALIVSGGHTLLVNVRGVGDYEILGRTLDDAAGEAFDKVAKLLGLGYPGGPEIEMRALQQTKSRRLTLSGGVSCNRALREDLRAACQKNGIELLVAKPWLCTDNAAMIAFAAMLRLENGIVSNLAEEIDPNLALA